MKLKTQKIRGNDYVVVNERVRAFRAHESFKDMSIETEILNVSDDRVVMIARVRDANGNIKATGHAEEVQTKSGVNSTSFIENCETSAVGRCLGFLGIGVDDSIATFEEVERAIERQEEAPEAEAPKEKSKSEKKHWSEVICPFKAHKGKTFGDIVNEGNSGYLKWFADKIDTVEIEEVKVALQEWEKENNSDGNQSFKKVA